MKKTQDKIEERVKAILEEYCIALICDTCTGTGTDRNGGLTETCKTCKGTGIGEWRHDMAIQELTKLNEEAIREAREEGKDEGWNAGWTEGYEEGVDSMV